MLGNLTIHTLVSDSIYSTYWLNSTHTRSLCLVPTDYGKRVYQGVRVKHTVKDLLAEKRLRQTSGSRFSVSRVLNRNVIVQNPLALRGFALSKMYLQHRSLHEVLSLGNHLGSTAMSGYYGVRRSFMSDLDFHNTKPLSNDVYASSLGAKSFPCDSSAVQGYPPLLDPYFTEDYRTAAVTPSTSSLFSTSSLPPLLPPFPNDSAHYLIPPVRAGDKAAHPGLGGSPRTAKGPR
ncbi:POU domain class 2-associating factor 2 [Pangshura tecta]